MMFTNKSCACADHSSIIFFTLELPHLEAEDGYSICGGSEMQVWCDIINGGGGVKS